MKQPTPNSCKCRKKAGYLFSEIYNEWVEQHTLVEFDIWLYDKFNGKIISIYFDP